MLSTYTKSRENTMMTTEVKKTIPTKHELLNFIEDYWGRYKIANLEPNKIQGPDIRKFIQEKCNTTDLSGMDLSGINFSYANLQGINLTGAILTDCNFIHANLLMTVLAKSTVNSNTNFSSSYLILTDLSNMNLRKVKFNHAKIHGTNFTNSTLQVIEFQQVSFYAPNFTNASIIDCSFRSAVILDANFRDAVLSNTHFSDAKLPGANFSKAELSNCKFHSATLSRANISSSTLNRTCFKNANLEYVNARHAELNYVRFNKTKLFSADFSDCRVTTKKVDIRTVNSLNYSEIVGKVGFALAMQARALSFFSNSNFTPNSSSTNNDEAYTIYFSTTTLKEAHDVRRLNLSGTSAFNHEKNWLIQNGAHFEKQDDPSAVAVHNKENTTSLPNVVSNVTEDRRSSPTSYSFEAVSIGVTRSLI